MMAAVPEKWSSIRLVKRSVEKKWGSGLFLRECLEPAGLFPLRFPLRGPGPGELSERFADAQEWIRQFRDTDATPPFRVEWLQVNNRVLGKNDLPVAVVFDTRESLLRFIGKAADCRLFENAAAEVLAVFPELKEWILKYPFVLLEQASKVQKLLVVAKWLKASPKPGIYLRQLSLPDIDTKFIESHKKLLAEWFDVILDKSSIDCSATGAKGFERRYGFLEKPVQVRFRILDSKKYVNGLSDLTIRADEFCSLNPDVDTVFITENDVNGLAFPMVKRSIVIFGRGYGFEYLQDAHWLHDKEILYWGDIDTHGFAILGQFRAHFPSARSFLMDRATLLSYRQYWVRETAPSEILPANLTEEERALYGDLQSQTFGAFVRLEQEFIPFDHVRRCLNGMGKTQLDGSM